MKVSQRERKHAAVTPYASFSLAARSLLNDKKILLMLCTHLEMAPIYFTLNRLFNYMI